MSKVLFCTYSDDIPYQIQYDVKKGVVILTLEDFAFTKEGHRAFVKSLRFYNLVEADRCVVGIDPIRVEAAFEEDCDIEEAGICLVTHLLVFLGRTYKTTRHVTNAYACTDEPSTKALIAKVNYVTCCNYVYRKSSTRFILVKDDSHFHYDIYRDYKSFDGHSFYKGREPNSISISKKKNGELTIKTGDVVMHFRRGGAEVLD